MPCSDKGGQTKVLFLGPEGTYSYQAALQQFRHLSNVRFIAVQSIPQCFERLEQDPDVSFSVVPIENSTNGQVVSSYDAFKDRMVSPQSERLGNRVFPKIEIVGEQFVFISHCLISPVSLDTTELSGFKTVRIYSHPQVWGQVSSYLNKLKKQCPNTQFETVDTGSTTQAVKMCMSSQNETELTSRSLLNLAIAGEAAATLYHAKVIDTSINDIVGNTTRFLILKRRGEPVPQGPTVSASKVGFMTFTIDRDIPGTLVDVLQVLKQYSVNMSSISSRPFSGSVIAKKWEYIFFIELDYDDSRGNWDQFYSEVGAKCLEWCLWGTFPRSERYYL